MEAASRAVPHRKAASDRAHMAVQAAEAADPGTPIEWDHRLAVDPRPAAGIPPGADLGKAVEAATGNP